MPNNPGRIDGDYSIVEKEEVKYVDPGKFGEARPDRTANRFRSGLLIVVAVVVLAVLVAFGMHLI